MLPPRWMVPGRVHCAAMKPPIGRDPRLCMSLAARPGNFGSRFHNHLYEALGLDYVYKAFTTRDLPAAIGGVRALGIRGCAISMPFKEAVIPLLDGLEASARAIDSVNTLVNEQGRLTGYNTDYVAVRRLIEKAQQQARLTSDTPFLLRGSGGMAKAVVAALRDAGLRSGTVVGSSPVCSLAPLRCCAVAGCCASDCRTVACSAVCFFSVSSAGAGRSFSTPVRSTVPEIVSLPIVTSLTLPAWTSALKSLYGSTPTCSRAK